MRKIRIRGHAHWTTSSYDDVVEIDDDDDPDEICRDMILEQIEWHWEDVK